MGLCVKHNYQWICQMEQTYLVQSQETYSLKVLHLNLSCPPDHWVNVPVQGEKNLNNIFVYSTFELKNTNIHTLLKLKQIESEN